MRPFFPSSDDIARRIVARVLALSDEDVAQVLSQTLGEFEDRHEQLEKGLCKRFAQVRQYLGETWETSPAREALIGAHFTHEYSPESTALFNPSIVPHPDQSGLPKGAVRFVLSLRATGEGHISSITFRTGIISAQHRITLTRPVPFVTEATRVPSAAYAKSLFAGKLQEAGVQGDFCQRVLTQLPETFVQDDLHRALTEERRHTESGDDAVDRAVRGILLLAESNYEVHFAADSQVSERVLFPSTASQRNGIEDARFVRFANDDGSFTYYATYTAYDGRITLPQLL
ncbi:MAG: glycosidase, partial [Myxococcota bacterium]